MRQAASLRFSTGSATGWGSLQCRGSIRAQATSRSAPRSGCRSARPSPHPSPPRKRGPRGNQHLGPDPWIPAFAGMTKRGRRGRSGCSSRPSQSKLFGFCPTIRRFVSPGGDAGIGSRGPMGRRGSPTNGGDRRAPALVPAKAGTRSATITGSRTRKGGASGCSDQVSTLAITSRAGLSMASFPEGILTEREPRYAELQVTTNFSFLRGAAHPDELVVTAAALGHAAIAITDRNSLAGVVRAHHAAKEVGLRLVVGCRLDLRDGTSLLAFPEDRAAYGRLTRLLTLGKRRAPKGECHLDYADVISHGEGQIVIVLPPADPHPTLPRERGRVGWGDFADRVAADFAGRAYLAAHHLYRGDDARRLARLAALGKATGLPLVATNDVLYHLPERHPLQDVLTCIRE